MDQLQYESSVRERVKKNTAELEAVLSLFNSFVASSSGKLLLGHAHKMVSAVQDGLQSPLSSVYCLQLWEGLCVSAIPDRKTGLTSI